MSPVLEAGCKKIDSFIMFSLNNATNLKITKCGKVILECSKDKIKSETIDIDSKDLSCTRKWNIIHGILDKYISDVKDVMEIKCAVTE